MSSEINQEKYEIALQKKIKRSKSRKNDKGRKWELTDDRNVAVFLKTIQWCE